MCTRHPGILMFDPKTANMDPSNRKELTRELTNKFKKHFLSSGELRTALE